jgi:GTP cyclohydrolase IB
MNRAEQPAILVPIPDVQSGRDERRIAIDQVGIKGLRYPLPFMDRDGVAHTTIATCNVYVALPEDRKGTHMSRLVALLEERAAPGAEPLTVATLRSVVEDLLVRLDAPGARIEFAFPFFVRKTAPVSGVASLLDYDVRLTAELVDGAYSHTISVSVPVTSLCPSSKEVSAYGAHNQRSIVTINVRPRDHMFVAELLRIAEDEASAELYGILKRADEKYVTERAYDNPRFVEDLVRGVAARLAEDSRIDGFVVEAENFESIHNHSAYARIARNF